MSDKIELNIFKKFFFFKNISSEEAEDCYMKNEIIYLKSELDDSPNFYSSLIIKNINGINDFKDKINKISRNRLNNEPILFYTNKTEKETNRAYLISSILIVLVLFTIPFFDEYSSKKVQEKEQEERLKKDIVVEYKPITNPFDGSVREVYLYLRDNLNDPDSYEGIDWSSIKTTGTGFVVRHKFRSKNQFGGYVVLNKIFIMDKKGNIIKVTE